MPAKSCVRLTSSLAFVLTLATAAPVLAQQNAAQGMTHGQSAKPNAAGSQAMMDTMHTMQQTMMAQPMTGDPDHDFATMMRAHHQGAIDMARIELEQGKDAELKKMARKVVEDQTKEIKQLDKWLDRHPPQQAQR
ncbi:CopM family metallochaperone [Azospirillum agricola]|uniref:CopM family metallochaperone n=1 Tax=Azospirillum agricola TaxID=1720247 RepID=UPI000A1CEAC5|nr:DUF305 domain-containing protein [Azospirillum agricola]